MIRCGSWPVGVCTWSLRRDLPGVWKVMEEAGIDHVHLAVGPVFGEGGGAYREAARALPWTVSATMIDFPGEDYSTLESIRRTGGIVPDAAWESNKARALEAVCITAELGVRYLSFHAGFIDHGDGAAYGKLLDRIRVLANGATEHGVTLLLETGQETAEDLARFLRDLDRSAVAVNFDPANMILYDKGDPVEAVGVLGPWIRHVHVKDARRTPTPGTWGEEVPWGEGEVDHGVFLRALAAAGFEGALAVEREAGEDRAGDVCRAVERLAAFQS